MTLVSLLVGLVILGFVWWAVTAIVRAFGIGDPIATLVRVILVLFAVLWLISALGFGHGFRLP